MLLQAFAQQMEAADPDLIVAGGHCSAYMEGGDPYLPFRQLLNLLAGDVELSRAAGLMTARQSHRLRQLFPLNNSSRAG